MDYLNCVETIDSNQTIDYKRGNLLRFDYNYKHVVMKMTNNSFSIFDINTLKTAKTYEVEGDIVNILIHEEVYHIMTVTKYDENNRNDANCEGKIYVISGLTLEIVDTISLNTYPYSTAVDKRGDIIIINMESLLITTKKKTSLLLMTCMFLERTLNDSSIMKPHLVMNMILVLTIIIIQAMD